MLKSNLLPFVALTLLWLLPAAAQSQELPFAVGEASTSIVPLERTVDAVIEAVNQSTVSAQTSGRIVEINFDVDDLVPKDSIILRLRDTEQRAALEQAQAALKEARARLREAREEYTRIKGVYEKKLVAKAEMDRASANLEAARAKLASAEAAVRSAEEQLGYTVVRAPYAGVVLQRHVELGEMASPGQPLMTGFSFEQLRAIANVPQVLVEQVRKFGQARVLLSGPDGRSLAAERINVLPYADSTSHTFKTRVLLPREVEGVYPGMFVKVAFRIGEQQRLLVPAKAVVHRSEVQGVYVVGEDGRVALRQVRLGRTLEDGQVEILAGLEDGERIALDPIRAGLYLKEQQVGGRP
jgi:RND family efflux transporter MFP subunit